MVVLDRREDHRARAIVEKLGALVEKRGVVLVPLDHERVPRPQAPGLPKIQRHAADQEGRITPGVDQQVRQQRGGGRLAVGTRHHHGVLLRQKQL